MSYEYMSGMGAGEEITERPPLPSMPQMWKGNFADCKVQGGAVAWGGLNLEGLTRTFQTSATGERHLHDCYSSRQSTESRPGQKEYCCYPRAYMREKQIDRDRQMAAFQAQQQAYMDAPFSYENELEDRRRYFSRYQTAPAPEGSPCPSWPGTVMRKVYFPIPKTEQEKAQMPEYVDSLRKLGCVEGGAPYDLEHVAMCCPPGVEVPAANGNGTTVTNGNGTAVVTNGNGEAAVVAAEEAARAAEHGNLKVPILAWSVLSLANAGIAALIAKGDDRKMAALVGAIATYVGGVTGITGQVGMALCPFKGEGAIACGLPLMGLTGIATGIAFRLKAKKDEA